MFERSPIYTPDPEQVAREQYAFDKLLTIRLAIDGSADDVSPTTSVV